MIFWKKIIFWVIFALFANFEPKRAGNGAKKRKIVFYKSVLEFSLEPISTLHFSIFSKNIKIVVP